jgi:hypothetical protein
MRYIIAIFCLFLSIGTTCSQTTTYPKAKTVLTLIVQKYQLDKDKYYEIEKRKEGIYLTKSDYDFSQEVYVFEEKYLIWNAQTQAYQTLPLDKNESEIGNIDEEIGRYFKGFTDTFNFDLIPLFNYVGWRKDVISLLSPRNDLNDTLYYALGRAYGEHSREFLTNYNGFHDTSVYLNPKMQRNSLTARQLADYKNVAQKGLEAYYKCYEKNPAFETIVGPIYLKYCDDVVDFYMILQMFQNEEEAKKVLIPDLFSDFWIETAKNLLKSCPQNAILLTYGDNDTYPLLYVQAQLGFRTDVLVANTSLLNLERYIFHLTQGVFDAKPMKLTLPFSFYQNKKSVYFQLNLQEKEDAQTMSSAQFFDILTQSKGHSVDVENKLLEWRSENDTIQWYLPDFLSREQIAQLDIFATDPNRPLCFAPTFPLQTIPHWSSYLSLEGNVMVLNKRILNNVARNILDIFQDADANYDKFMNTYSIDSKYIITEEKLPHYSITLFSTVKLANILVDKNDNTKAKNVIDRYLKIFNNNRYPLNSIYHRYYVELYLKIGEEVKAEKLAEQIWKNEKKANNQEAIKDLKLTFLSYAKTYKNAFLERLISEK